MKLLKSVLDRQIAFQSACKANNWSIAYIENLEKTLKQDTQWTKTCMYMICNKCTKPQKVAIKSILDHKNWCRSCSQCKKFAIDDLRTLARERMGKLISTEYNNNKELLIWECIKGHQWKACFSNIKNKESWCPTCKDFNFNEEMSRHILEKIFTGHKFTKSRKVLSSGLELDGYNSDLRLAFEYNGIQHYKYDTFFHESEEDFILQQKRDDMKRRECIENDIYLIEIPYVYRTYYQIKDFIIEGLQGTKYLTLANLNQDWKANIEEIIILDGNKLKLDELVSIAEQRNGKCLSTSYCGSYQKLQFKCEIDYHPPFNTRPNDIKQGKWCPLCGKTKKKTPDEIRNIIGQIGGQFIEMTSQKIGGKSRTVITYIDSQGNTKQSTLDNLNKKIRKK